MGESKDEDTTSDASGSEGETKPPKDSQEEPKDESKKEATEELEKETKKVTAKEPEKEAEKNTEKKSKKKSKKESKKEYEKDIALDRVSEEPVLEEVPPEEEIQAVEEIIEPESKAKPETESEPEPPEPAVPSEPAISEVAGTEAKAEAVPASPEPTDDEIIEAKESVEPVEEDILDQEDVEAKKLEYDFLPQKDTLTIITHLDVDGLLSAAAIHRLINNPQMTEKQSEIKDLNKVRIFFSSPSKIFSSLAKSVPDLNKIDDTDFSIGQLYICDLSLHRDTLLGSTIYDKTKWFDHHEINTAEQYDSEIENIELIIDPTANSATAIICDYFKIDCDFRPIAEEIDTNNIETENAKRLRDLVGALRLTHSGFKLQIALIDLAQKIAEDLSVINNESYDQLIKEYTEWVEGFNNIIDENLNMNEITGHKIGILEVENAAPVYSIYNKLKTHPNGPFDIIAVLIHKYYRLGKDKNNKFKNKKYTKVEFRTHTGEEIIELAKLLGGGGHKYASGTTIHDGLDKDELIKTLESYLSTPAGNVKPDE
ncbi:DHHA1 domain-containing protein [[Eubacterium] cellulosolvens]